MESNDDAKRETLNQLIASNAALWRKVEELHSIHLLEKRVLPANDLSQRSMEAELRLRKTRLNDHFNKVMVSSDNSISERNDFARDIEKLYREIRTLHQYFENRITRRRQELERIVAYKQSLIGLQQILPSTNHDPAIRISVEPLVLDDLNRDLEYVMQCILHKLNDSTLDNGQPSSSKWGLRHLILELVEKRMKGTNDGYIQVNQSGIDLKHVKMLQECQIIEVRKSADPLFRLVDFRD
jgi:hypothetical protein